MYNKYIFVADKSINIQIISYAYVLHIENKESYDQILSVCESKSFIYKVFNEEKYANLALQTFFDIKAKIHTEFITKNTQLIPTIDQLDTFPYSSIIVFVGNEITYNPGLYRIPLEEFVKLKHHRYDIRLATTEELELDPFQINVYVKNHIIDKISTILGVHSNSFLDENEQQKDICTLVLHLLSKIFNLPIYKKGINSIEENFTMLFGDKILNDYPFILNEFTNACIDINKKIKNKEITFNNLQKNFNNLFGSYP